MLTWQQTEHFSYFALYHNRATKIPSQPWGWVKCKSRGSCTELWRGTDVGDGVACSVSGPGPSASWCECITLWHLREARTHGEFPRIAFFLGNDFQWGEIKGSMQFLLYLLFIFILLPPINSTTCHSPLKQSWLERCHREESWRVWTSLALTDYTSTLKSSPS